MDTYRSGELAPNLLFIKSDANGYRLLTRDEWPYAGRGGQLSQNYVYSGSNTAVDVARFAVNSSVSECPIFGNFGTWSVGSLLPNELGIYDMSGNVNEWIWDGPNITNRYNPGGSFFTADAQEFLLAITYSLSNTAVDAIVDLIGFRLARNAPVPEAAATVESKASSLSGKGKRNDFSRALKKPGQLK